MNRLKHITIVIVTKIASAIVILSAINTVLHMEWISEASKERMEREFGSDSRKKTSL